MAVLGATAVAVGSLGGLGLVSPARGGPVWDPVTATVVSVDAAGSAPVADLATAPAMSEAGGVVAFEGVASEAEAVPRVWIRDRVGATTRAVAELGSRAPGISGDGCVVAYSVVEEQSVSLTAVDRCSADRELPLPIGTLIDERLPNIDDIVAAPALSFDGSIIVWSTGDEIRRYVRTPVSGLYERSHAFDTGVALTPDSVTGAAIDMSADGDTVVYLSGPGAVPFAPTPPNVHVWNVEGPAVAPTVEVISSTLAGAPGAGDSASPTVSADGLFVVFASTSLDLGAVGDATIAAPFIVGFDRVDRSTQVLVEDGRQPSVSGDGTHVVYRRVDGLRVLTLDGEGTDRGVDALAAAAPVTATAISQFGRWVAFDSATMTSVEPPVAGTQVWIADLKSSDPAVLDTSTTTPPTTTPPTTTPPVTTSPGGSSAGPTTTVATSLPPGEPTTGTTVPGSFVEAPIARPTWPTTYTRITLPPYVPATPTYASSVYSSPVGGQPFVTNLPPVAMPVVFDPTVVSAGRRTASVTLTNSSTATVTLGSTTVEPAGPFSVVADTCVGSLLPGAGCSVEVQFAPVVVGPATSSVVFRMLDGSVVSARLDGTGTPEPSLDIVPGVAGQGQTVTVFGSGFPAGSVVEFERVGSQGTDPVTVGPDGTIAHVIVVLPNTPTGPMQVMVHGQADVFADVVTELLVSTRGSGSGDAALRSGVGAASGR